MTFVGVGPGDPSLITVAGLDAIKNSSLVAFPVSVEGGKSIAAEIVSKLIRHKKKMQLLFPMTTDPDVLKKSWKNASLRLVNAVKDNNQVVFLSQGDVSLYSTSAYINFAIKSYYSTCKVKIIPGINSFSAAAALGQFPLSLQQEQLLISPVPDEKKEFERILEDGITSQRVIVFLKLGFRWVWVREILEKKGLLEKSLFAQRLGFSDQKVSLAKDIPADSKPYFSLLIIRKQLPSIVP